MVWLDFLDNKKLVRLIWFINVFFFSVLYYSCLPTNAWCLKCLMWLTDFETFKTTQNFNAPRAAGSPAPASGRQGFCPRQTDLGQTSSALNNTHIDWGTWNKTKQHYPDDHTRGDRVTKISLINTSYCTSSCKKIWKNVIIKTLHQLVAISTRVRV